MTIHLRHTDPEEINTESYHRCKDKDVHLFPRVTSALLFILAGSLYRIHSPLLSKNKGEKQRRQLRNEKLTLELSFLSYLLGSSLSVENNSEVTIDFAHS